MRKIEDGYRNQEFLEDKAGFILMIANIMFLYVRIQEQIPILKPFKLPGIIGLIVFIWFLIKFKGYIFSNKYFLWLMLFILTCAISSIGAVNNIGIKRTIKWTWVYFPIAASIYFLVCNEKRFNIFFTWWCAIHFFFALIIFKNGGRGPGDFLNDENDAALGIGMAIPIVFYMLQWNNLEKRQKLFLYAAFGILCLSIVATASRGGLLGLFSVFGMLWFFSNKKVMILTVSVLGIVSLSGIIYSLLPPGYVEDFTSGMTNSEDSTRVERFHSWEISWVMFKDNFLFGVGPGNFPYYAGTYEKFTSWWQPNAKSLAGRQVHSMYFEVLADLGTIGTSIYFGIIFVIMKKLYRTQKLILKVHTENITETVKRAALMARALFISMACYLVSGAFISVIYYPHYLIWVAMSAIAIRAAQNEWKPPSKRIKL